MAELVDQQFRSVLVDGLIDRDHHVQIEQLLDQIGALFAHPLGQFADGDRFGNDDFADLLLARLRRTALHPAFLLARPLERGERAGATALVLVERLVDGELARAALVRPFDGRCALVVLLLLFGLLGFGTRDGREAARCRCGSSRHRPAALRPVPRRALRQPPRRALPSRHAWTLPRPCGFPRRASSRRPRPAWPRDPRACALPRRDAGVPPRPRAAAARRAPAAFRHRGRASSAQACGPPEQAPAPGRAPARVPEAAAPRPV